jgi:hypothetical protein
METLTQQYWQIREQLEETFFRICIYLYALHGTLVQRHGQSAAPVRPVCHQPYAIHQLTLEHARYTINEQDDVLSRH